MPIQAALTGDTASLLRQHVGDEAWSKTREGGLVLAAARLLGLLVARWGLPRRDQGLIFSVVGTGALGRYIAGYGPMVTFSRLPLSR
jgi:hypothetical protein